MLKQRTAGDNSWPIACSCTTLGTVDEELDLSGAHLSYGDFEEATFKGKAIRLHGAGLAHAYLSGSKLTAENTYGNAATIDFSGANLAHADLSGSELIATTSDGEATIDFTDTMNADLRDSDYWSGPGFIALTAVL